MTGRSRSGIQRMERLERSSRLFPSRSIGNARTAGVTSSTGKVIPRDVTFFRSEGRGDNARSGGTRFNRCDTRVLQSSPVIPRFYTIPRGEVNGANRAGQTILENGTRSPRVGGTLVNLYPPSTLANLFTAGLATGTYPVLPPPSAWLPWVLPTRPLGRRSQCNMTCHRLPITAASNCLKSERAPSPNECNEPLFRCVSASSS